MPAVEYGCHWLSQEEASGMVQLEICFPAQPGKTEQGGKRKVRGQDNYQKEKVGWQWQSCVHGQRQPQGNPETCLHNCYIFH